MESVLKIFKYNFHNKAGTYLLHIIYNGQIVALKQCSYAGSGNNETGETEKERQGKY
jgi:hypothetical protein